MSYWFKNEGDKHIEGLDSFRGIAAFLVFLFHYWTFYPTDRLNFWGIDSSILLKSGHIGVDIFFVLSGFLLFLSLTKDFNKIGEFFKRRIKRLVPLAVIFTIAVFLFRGPEYWMNIEVYPIKNLLYHLLFLQSLSIDTYWGLHPVMWSLTVEALFIVILPILLFIGKNKRWHFIFILILLIIINWLYRFYLIRYFPEWSAQERIFYSEQLWGRFDQFAFGTLFGVYWLNQKTQSLSDQKLTLLALLTGLFSIIISIIIFGNYQSGFRDNIFLQVFLHSYTALAFVLFLLGFLLNKNNTLKSIFAPKIFSYFGLISYSFFLWHFPILSLLSKFIDNAFIGFILSLSFSIFLSIISYFFIEKYFANYLFQVQRK